MALTKLGESEDVASVIVSLASDSVSGHVTGQVITVAGGMEGRVLNEI
jgi:3-oxoacyl-[acyl-carrier protein] reductase